MDLELEGKVAIITGGNRGIGRATALELAREGADVALVARSKALTEDVAGEIARETGRRVIAALADTGDDAAVKSMVADVVARLGRVDILVNAAAEPSGQREVPKPTNTPREMLDEHINIKVMGYLRTAREVAPYMARQKFGRIINVSGLGARRTGNTVGSIRNVAVVALSKNLADELSSSGINVTTVHPGMTRTEKVDEMIKQRAAAEGVSFSEIEKRMASDVLIGRLPTAKELAQVIVFLASPKSITINGEVIVAGGGDKKVIFY